MGGGLDRAAGRRGQATRRCVVLDIPGLVARYVPGYMPALAAHAARGRMVPLRGIVPALNCPAQATFLTGTYPSEHGIVADGWYHRDIAEVRYWPQSAAMIQRPPIWETARRRDPGFTCAKLFWFMNMYGTADWTVTPQPHFAADGRLVPGLYTEPPALSRALIEELGPFPIFDWWGPRTSIRASRWIADAACWTEEQHRPSLSLVFLPHLDYAPHIVGPDPEQIRGALAELDALLAGLLEFYAGREVDVLVVSEYGVVPVSRPIHLNRRFRQRGWIGFRYAGGREVLHPGACEAFAAADMQVAHIYVRDPARIEEVRAVVAAEPGVAAVLDAEGKRAHHLDHPRSGDLVALAEPDAWFTYYFWLDDAAAPDYARTVDIFRKPGYDPIELYLDPKIETHFGMVKLAMAMARDRLGVRSPIEVVSLDAGLLRGAHGVTPPDEAAPILISPRPDLVAPGPLDMVAVHDTILAHLGLAPPEPA